MLERLRSWTASCEDFGVWLQTVTPTYDWGVPHLRLIREQLAQITTGAVRRQAFFMPPRHGKSALITIRYSAWRLVQNPKLRVIVGAYSQSLAQHFSRQVQRLVVSSGVALADNRHSVDEWETRSGGLFKAVGVGSGVVGYGGDLIVVDDPVKSRREADSAAYRNWVWNWYKEDLFTRLEPGGSVVLVLARRHPDDVAGRILSSAEATDWSVLRLPAEAEEGDPLGRAVGDPLWADRFDKKALAGVRTTLGSWAYAAQYQQRPTALGGSLFLPEWFAMERWVDRPPLEVVKRIRYWDKASTENGGSFSCGVRMSITADGKIYVEDVTRGQWSVYRRNQTMREVAIADGHDVLVWTEQEPGSGGKESAEATILQLNSFDVHARPVTGSKTLRAEPFAAQCEAGNVYLVRGSWCSAYVEELCRFSGGAQDDQVDASSGAYNRLVGAARFSPPSSSRY